MDEPEDHIVPFRWGIVGAGVIARQFADDLRHVRGAEVAAVHSRRPELAAQFAQAVGAKSVYRSLEEMLQSSEVDAVYLATPNNLHAAQALQTLTAGKPVLVEKPLATTSHDAAEIAAAVAGHGCFAMEALWSRFLPAVRQAKSLLAQGAIGEPISAEAELAFLQPERPDSRFYDPGLGGGAALDLGVYPLSLAVHFFGQPEAVKGNWIAARSGVDRRATFELAFASGVKGTFSCGFDCNGQNAFTIFGSKGALRIAPPFLKAQRLTLYRGALRDLPLVGPRASARGLASKLAARMPVPGLRNLHFPFPGSGLQFEAMAVMQAVRAKSVSDSIMPLADSIAVLKTVEAVLSRPAASGS